MIGLGAEPGDVFASLRAFLASPLYTIDLAITGDSIANNVGASDCANGPFLTSGWADRLARHLAAMVAPFAEPVISSPAPDCDVAIWTAETDVDLARPDFTLRASNGAALPMQMIGDDGAATGRLLVVPPGAYLDFVYFGGWVYGVFPRCPYADAGARWRLWVDGRDRRTASAWADPSTCGALVSAGMPLGWHTVKLFNDSTSEPLMLECVRVQRQVIVRNLAASGTAMFNYLPGAPTWPITRVPATVTHLLDLSGTNERVSHGHNAGIPLPDHPARMERNTLAVLDWLEANRPNARVGLITANKALGLGEALEAPSVYCFPMADVARVRRDIARRRGLPLVDGYSRSLEWAAAGRPFAADLLHPNDAFHAEIFSMVCARIFNAG